ncbi:MAG: hypothetical protein JOY71_24615 [Acetobacteraceae bacterium]|nr:hypothetical protein [Acetobacteraceae bacterium]MBV8525265.1 hypothetical protein [Acetobacteraceae bacterium]MBV8592413.1 hypothetical protein [Acetobacteraceae bacterium]
MAENKSKTGETDRHEEAKHLAEEAVEEMSQGNKEEGKFVLEEARKLDPSAVEEVLDDQGKTPAGSSSKKP